MSFFQIPPRLPNPYRSDRLFRAYLQRALPKDVHRAVIPEIEHLAGLVEGRLQELQEQHRGVEPKLVSWDAWGHRIDRIELSALWEEAGRIAVEAGLVATAYEQKNAEYSRVHQFALVYLFGVSAEGTTGARFAMADGAARTLINSGNEELRARAVPRLLSRDPATAWTSGQWMTERTGGSDVAICETVARRDGDRWKLYGTKWFTTAATSEMALTLARPEGNPDGGPGLALFYLEPRDAAGRLDGIRINRLKDKLGTRNVPTAELTLDGAPAIPVAGLDNGIKRITPMLKVTRTWNAVNACGRMRRGLLLARDYAAKRIAFGRPLSEKPLHLETLADLEAQCEGATLLAFRAAELLGREETAKLTDDEEQLLRLITPIAKLTTAKQTVAIMSEVIEAFGGAGYIEDTGLPVLLRDAQVLPIWEGTTNILALDVLRAIGRSTSILPIVREVGRRVERAAMADCASAGAAARNTVAHAQQWLTTASTQGPAALEAGARRFALSLGHALELALLVDHAVESGDRAAAAAARRLAQMPIDSIRDEAMTDEARLVLEL